MNPKTYSEAGVDVKRGDDLVQFIRGLKSPGISKEIGGFAARLQVDFTAYEDPVLLSTSDGVGTKILIAKMIGKYDTIGIDLVAMSVNDILAEGGIPVGFQDYIACGRIKKSILEPVLRGIVRGCELADCRLIGGETAELPDMYGEDDIDLAGFCIGVGNRSDLLPKTDRMKPGDVVMGLRSSGIHSNGLSLARKVLTGEEQWRELLTPTRIYTKEMKTILKQSGLAGAAHITGGGLTGNISRIVPKHLKAHLYYDWDIPEIFNRIQIASGASDVEMKKTYNLGIGMALIFSEGSDVSAARNIEMIKIGEIRRLEK
jgi:phosphoribosylformylglycinamidine cyclo-ligase